MSDDTLVRELREIAHDWDRATVTNDAAAIGRYLADDWTIVGSDGRVSDKATFLALVASRLAEEV